MNEEKRNTILQDIIHGETFITALVAGLLIPIIAWSIEFVHGKVTVSFSGIGTIHKLSPALWILDLVPFLFIAGSWFLDQRQKRINGHLATQLSERDIRMNTMADFAQNIGEGNYTSKLAPGH